MINICEIFFLINLWILCISLNYANSNSIYSEMNLNYKSKITALKIAGNQRNRYVLDDLHSIRYQIENYLAAFVAIQSDIIYDFAGIFTQTFYDAKYDNIVFVSKGSINSHDEVFDEYKTIVQSSENSMIRYSVLNIGYVIMTIEQLLGILFHIFKSS